MLSFRLGGSDGVSVEAGKWRAALDVLGYRTVTVAGEGPVDRLVTGLAIDAAAGPSRAEMTAVLEDADLVVVENVCSLPLNPAAAAVVAEVLSGRPAVLHHHDLPWQRPRFAGHPPPPDDPRWIHVTINDLSRRELRHRGIVATTVYNAFDTRIPDAARRAGWRSNLRAALGLDRHDRLVLQPTRALERKNVPGGMAAARQLGGRYWLLGAAEDGYGPTLDRLVADAAEPVLLGWPGPVGDGGVAAAYAACDVVALPSTWEGFGNPALESAVHRRPLVIGPYPVASELESFGFEWFHLDALARLRAWLDSPDPGLLERNAAVVEAHFSIDRLPARIDRLLAPFRVRGPNRSRT